MLDWRTLDLPLVAGLDTGSDPRALEPPRLTRAENISFPRRGGVDLRHPYSKLGDISGVRRLAVYRDELIAFTKDRIFSWSPALNDWQDRDEYLAAASEERTVFTATMEQINPDRAALDGVVVYTWTEDGDGRSRVAALDAETGAVLLTPLFLNNFQARPRAVGSSFHIYALNADDELFVAIFTPANVGDVSNWGGAAVSNAATGGGFDVDVSGGVAYVVWQGEEATEYGLASVTTDGTVARQTEARAYDGPICIAARGEGTDTQVAVFRPLDQIGGLIRGDLFDSTLTATDTDVTVGALGSLSLPTQISAAFNDEAEASGEYRCNVFWSLSITASSNFYLYTSFLDTDGDTVGTTSESARRFKNRLGLAARPFAHGGSVYVWCSFGADTSANNNNFVGVQNAYFLYRDDGQLIARAVQDVGGGRPQTEGHLPNVQALGDDRYAWLATERRILTGDKGAQAYAARTPREVVLEFDADVARRTVELGRTLYVTGAPPSQFDGEGVTELGFLIYPWYLFSIFGSNGSGSIDPGGYSWMTTYAWENAAGDLERSTTTAVSVNGPQIGNTDVDIDVAPLHVTKKTDPRGEVTVEIWRKLKNTLEDAPFYRVTGTDPTVTTGDNAYLENDTTVGFLEFVDDIHDDDLESREQILPPGTVLGSLPPPSATIIYANDERVFLAGVAGDPNKVWYSAVRSSGEVASFDDGLRVEVPKPVTALAEQAETLVVFCENAVYALPGEGFDNTGGGANYGPAQIRSVDVGAVHADAVAITSDGTLFKSRKGWYLLDLSFNAQYVGAAVKAFDDEEVLSVAVLENAREVRVVTPNRVLVFNTEVSAWASWTIEGALDAVVYQGVYHYATEDGVFAERGDYEGVDYGYDIEFAPIRFGGLARFGAVRRFQPVAEWRSPHALRVRVKYDDEDEYTDDVIHKVRDGTPYRLDPGPGHGFKRPRCQAAVIRLTTTSPDGSGPPTGEAVRLTGLSVKIGYKSGLGRLGPGRR
jgi:hypothetical protein